jgi:hypothetical protein
MHRHFLHASIIGLSEEDGFTYNPLRPARHCGICGDSFQPEAARSPIYDADPEVRLAVDIEIKQWAIAHNKKHSEKEHIEHIKSGRLLTPEAAVRLIPLGIYPIDDLYFDDEIRQAGFEAPRAPNDDVPDR